jgi:predicted metalloprotease
VTRWGVIATLTLALGGSVAGCGQDEDAGRPQDFRTFFQQDVQPSVDAYWRAELSRTFGARYRPPRIRGGYRPDRDTVICNGQNRARSGDAFYCRPGRFIAWDEPGLLFSTYRDLGPWAAAVIVAHEWGHAIQHQLGLSPSPDIQKELGADCLAGAWAKRARAERQAPRGALDRVVKSLYRASDRPARPWFSDRAHGDAVERNGAFFDGLRGGATACVTAGRPHDGQPPRHVRRYVKPD